MAKSKKTAFGRRGFLKGAAAGLGAGLPTFAQIATAALAPVEIQSNGRPGSDFMLDVIKSLGIEYCAANPGTSFRGLHESLINYGNNTCAPQKVRPSLSGLLLQIVFVVQPAQNWLRFDAITKRQHMTMDRCRNSVLGRLRDSSRMRRRARTDLCGGRSVMVVPTASVPSMFDSSKVKVLFTT